MEDHENVALGGDQNSLCTINNGQQDFTMLTRI